MELDSRGISVWDMVHGPDGAIWFVATDSGTSPFLGRLNLNDHAMERFALPSIPQRIAVAPDGTFVISSSERIYRANTSGTIEVLAECGSCWAKWLEVTPDGTIWLWSGRVEPGGAFIPHRYGGWDAAVGPDGRIWVAAETNAIRAFDQDGSLAEFPFASPADVPHAIVSSQGSLWYGVYGAIRQLDPETSADLQLRYGDIVTIEEEQNSRFEGTHPVLAFHRRGRAPFLRRIERDNPFEGGVYALGPQHIVIEESDWSDETADGPIALVLDGTGVLRNSISGPQGSGGAGIVVDRQGHMHALRFGTGYSLVTVDADGVLLRDSPLPIEDAMRIDAVDLGADQCTLFYAGRDWSDAYEARGRIGRINVCVGTVLLHFAADLPDIPRDLRILPDGDLLVVYATRLVRYDATGAIVHQLDATPEEWFHAVALDRDPRFVWIGSSDLRRVNLATGEIVERLPVYGYPEKISVIGEPRAARQPARRRAVRR
ncbi:MAG: hypothetical protein ACXW5U_18890 [Thermoanaerobaculia bacterium]